MRRQVVTKSANCAADTSRESCAIDTKKSPEEIKGPFIWTKRKSERLTMRFLREGGESKTLVATATRPRGGQSGPSTEGAVRRDSRLPSFEGAKTAAHPLAPRRKRERREARDERGERRSCTARRFCVRRVATLRERGIDLERVWQY